MYGAKTAHSQEFPFEENRSIPIATDDDNEEVKFLGTLPYSNTNDGVHYPYGV